jgi:maltose alpha-D-glucosyltransferase/alpha-amylase
MVRVLGYRTGDFHLGLAGTRTDPAFAPEPFTDHYRIGLYHSLLSLSTRAFQVIRERGDQIPPDASELESQIKNFLRPLRTRRFDCMRIRQHGHYHLGQVLFTGKDFVIIDLEGDPLRTLSDRRVKRCPLRDVACMLFSFLFASLAANFGLVPGIQPHSDEEAMIEKCGAFWYRQVSEAFLTAYLTAMSSSELLPASSDDVAYLLRVMQVEDGLTRLQEADSDHRDRLLTVAWQVLRDTTA